MRQMRDFFAFVLFYWYTLGVRLWQIRILLNNLVYVFVRYMEGLQKLLSYGAFHNCSSYELYTAPKFRSCSTCSRVVIRTRHLCCSPAQHAVVHGSARKLFSHMLTVFLYTLLCSADFPVFWPGIFKPRQLVNDFHSSCLQAILIMFVAQSNEENY